jgi:hypothetical protein
MRRLYTNFLPSSAGPFEVGVATTPVWMEEEWIRKHTCFDSGLKTVVSF